MYEYQSTVHVGNRKFQNWLNFFIDQSTCHKIWLCYVSVYFHAAKIITLNLQTLSMCVPW